MDDAKIADMLDKLVPIIARHLGINKDTITLTTHLADDLGLRDAIELADMIMQIQDEFRFEYSNEEFKRLVTVEDIVLLLLDKLTTGADDSDNLLDQLRPLIAQLLIVPEAKLCELGADGLAVALIAGDIEDKFGVTVSPQELKRFVTVGDIINFLVANSKKPEEALTSPG